MIHQNNTGMVAIDWGATEGVFSVCSLKEGTVSGNTVMFFSVKWFIYH